MIKPTYTYQALVNKVHDGDSLTDCDIDMGMYIWSCARSVRINGIDTPEVRGPDKKAGKIVRDYLKKMIEGKAVIIETQKPDKYGRILANVYYQGVNISDNLISMGYAKPYWGGKKEAWTKEELKHITGQWIGRGHFEPLIQSSTGERQVLMNFIRWLVSYFLPSDPKYEDEMELDLDYSDYRRQIDR